jgi:hypothetical protein
MIIMSLRAERSECDCKASLCSALSRVKGSNPLFKEIGSPLQGSQ